MEPADFYYQGQPTLVEASDNAQSRLQKGSHIAHPEETSYAESYFL